MVEIFASPKNKQTNKQKREIVGFNLRLSSARLHRNIFSRLRFLPGNFFSFKYTDFFNNKQPVNKQRGLR